jgi:hypothetical protein
MACEIDTFNKFAVGSLAGGVVILNAPARTQKLTREECLLLSAYLVTMCGATEAEFVPVLNAVQGWV